LEIFQNDRKSSFGLRYQLEQISKTWLRDNSSPKSADLKSADLKSAEIAQIIQMGFSEALAKKALSVSKNMMLAVEMLVNGEIPCSSDHGSSKDDSKYLSKDKVHVNWSHGFFYAYMDYILQRFLTLPNYCVICDEPHQFGNLLKPSVCLRPLCTFGYQQLGLASDTALSTMPEVVDLLVILIKTAVKSQRRDLIVNPYPLVVDPQNSDRLILDPKNKDFNKLQQIMDEIPSIRDLQFKQNSKAHLTLQWIVTSNRSHLVKIPNADQIVQMRTTHQFLMLSQDPEREARFLQLKEESGSVFAFHGSRLENWHSILRNGLINASGSKYQLNGAAYGNGIYLSTDTSVSAGYSGLNCDYSSSASSSASSKKRQNKNKQDAEDEQLSEQIKLIAICEVIDSKTIKKTGNIWVVPEPEHVCTRFLMIYPSDSIPGRNTTQMTEDLHQTLAKYQF
jgi:poly [ADP-ribose] polymerase 6/8